MPGHQSDYASVGSSKPRDENLSHLLTDRVELALEATKLSQEHSLSKVQCVETPCLASWVAWPTCSPWEITKDDESPGLAA